ncbi:ABC transporter permease [Roseibium sp. CAU 1637]|uniref:ABC transporter permease n=1 Tax=Roseibium limicola TaxID=2816037 RepID=A0A939JAC9_9HYPH|nr:ABC transporter permease [Roseibium limicola]MBO0347301.1 ABC transporter permease [Roseibium limicola]
MNKQTGGGPLAVGYSLLFFAFLFGPLIIMVVTAFNSSSFPRITPWECFTTEWFGVLFGNSRLMGGLLNSVVIGFGVVCIAVPVGLAGALALSELGPRLRATLYTVLITPILVPGVVLGISTIVFWGAVGRGVGAGYDSLFFNGMFLTLAGQVTFVSAYAMLVFMARLQRFDPTLTEAALDLGATPGQAFRKILLPFLAPAIGSAAFLTLLASFENYNTTVFTIMSQSTFTTALASKVRLGTDPSLSALAVIIIGITLIGAMVNEAQTRRKDMLRSGRAAQSRVYGNPVLSVLVHPLSVFFLLIAIVGFLSWQGSQQDAGVCKQQILDGKRARQEELLEAQRERMKAQKAAEEATKPTVSTQPASPSAFGGAFNSLAPKAEPAPAESANPSPFGGAFNNLTPTTDD